MATVTLTTPTTLDVHPRKLFHFPLSGAAFALYRAAMLSKSFIQQTAASVTAALIAVAAHQGPVRKVLIGISVAPGAGESIVYDVLVNGVSIITVGATSITLDSTSTVGLYDVTQYVTAGAEIKVGDRITTTFTYTAGAGAAPKSEVTVEWG